MPRAPRVCSLPGCPKTADSGGRCSEHKPAPWTGTSPIPNRSAHRRWARAVLERDAHTCRRCGAPATEADHIINRAAAPHLALDVNNGQALCRACHRAKTKAEAAAGRRAAR